MILHLPLKELYFLQIVEGEKLEEYRLKNDHWTKKLVGRHYDAMLLTLGYPKACDTSRRIVLPYFGYVEKTICHPHFGGDPVQVFAIDVSHYRDFRVI